MKKLLFLMVIIFITMNGKVVDSKERVAQNISNTLNTPMKDIKGKDIKDYSLKGIKVAILATDGFEQSELVEPRKALDAAGAKTYIIAPKHTGKIQGWNKANWADKFKFDVSLSMANANNYDALFLPGGVINPDALRMNDSAVAFVKKFVDAGKPIAAICHGPWTLINANGVKGYTVTSWPSLKVDLINAGAKWVDKAVVIDRNLITSRKPEDIPAFNPEMIKLFSQRIKK